MWIDCWIREKNNHWYQIHFLIISDFLWNSTTWLKDFKCNQNVLASLWYSYVHRQQLTFAYYHAKANFAIALNFSLWKSVFRLITFVYLPFKSTDFDMQLKDCVTKKERDSKKSHFGNLLYNRILYYSTFVTFIRDSYNKSFISSIFRSSSSCYQNKGGLISDVVFTLVSPSKQWAKSRSLNFSI